MFLTNFIKSPDKLFFSLVLLALMVIYFTGTNTVVFLWLNKLSSYTGKTIWVYLTHLGDAIIIFAFASCLLIYKKKLLKDFLLGAVVTAVVVQSIKFGLNVARPPRVLDADLFILLQEKLVALSFPSGHTASVFLVAAILYYQLNINVFTKWLLLFFALIAGLSRIAVGVHWPVDVLGGALLGWLIALASIFINHKLAFRFKAIYFWFAWLFFAVVLALLLNNGAIYKEVSVLYWLAVALLVASLSWFVLLNAFKHYK